MIISVDQDYERGLINSAQGMMWGFSRQNDLIKHSITHNVEGGPGIKRATELIVASIHKLSPTSKGRIYM